LELYGEARFVGNSHGLMIYRIGLLATRTTARGFGDLYLADSNFDSVWQQTKDLLVKDAPGILAKWMASLITRKLHSENSLPNPAATKRSVSEEVTEKVIRYLLSPILDITFWQLYSRRRSENPETVDQFAPRFGQKVSEDTVRLVADLIVMGFADSASDAKQRERREDICELVLTVLELAYGEFQALRATAEKEKKSVWEVWTGDVGFHLLRLLSTAARDFAMIWAGKKIKASVARDYRGKQLAKLIEDAVRDTFDEKKVSKPTTEPLHISKEEQKELRRGFDEKAPFPAVSKDVGAEDTHDGGKAKPLDKTIVEQKMPPRTGREANDKMLQEVIKETRNKELEKKKQAAAFKNKQHRRDTSMRATSR
jgi:hypothetical protein